MKNIIKQNLKYILLCTTFFITNFLYFIDYSKDLSIPIEILIAFIFISIFSYIVLYYIDKFNFKIENKYLVISLILGILFFLALPMSKVPDEFNHFLRAYEVSRRTFNFGTRSRNIKWW